MCCFRTPTDTLGTKDSCGISSFILDRRTWAPNSSKWFWYLSYWQSARSAANISKRIYSVVNPQFALSFSGRDDDQWATMRDARAHETALQLKTRMGRYQWKQIGDSWYWTTSRGEVQLPGYRPFIDRNKYGEKVGYWERRRVDWLSLR